MDFEHIHPSRRALIRGLLLAAGFAPGLLALVKAAGANSQVPVIPGVQEFSGDFRINDHGARVHQPVRPGDTVTTGPGSSGVIIVGAHAYLIRELSEITFYAEDFQESPSGAISGTLEVVTGAVLSVFGETETNIRTPFASIGIRGTGCYVAIEPGRTYACVCYGRGVLDGRDGKHLETVTTTYHDSPRYIYPPGQRKRIEKAEVIDHTDAELRVLEALVGRRPPFDRASFKKRGGGGDY